MSKINWKKIFVYGVWFVTFGLLIYTRFVNLDWGLPYPMHPDERNMANALQQLKCEIPNIKFQIPNLKECFNPHFFAYGQFPLYLSYGGVQLMKFLNGDLGTPISFQEAVFSLRMISAVSSVITVFILLRILGLLEILGRLEKKNFILYSLFFILFTFSPVLIQFAHFGTTESLLILFYSFIIYISLLYLQRKIQYSIFIILSSLFSGLAIATKVSSIAFSILTIFVLMTCVSRSYKRLILLGKFVLLTIVFFIFFSPHTIISFREFFSSVQYESAIALGQVKVFYTRQFDHSIPIIFQVTKIFPYALGWPVFILGSLGFLALSWKDKKINLLRFAILIYFIPNAFLYVKWSRFMAPVFPIVIIFATLFINEMRVINVKKIIIVIITILPGLAYLSVYQNLDVRFKASEWIYKNIPENAYILSETANIVDLPLPNKSYNGYKNYNYISFNFYDLDESPKLQSELKDHLEKADYIFIPSRRLFANHAQEKYKILNQYYVDLISGKLGFEKVAEFDSFPKICWPFNKNCLVFEDEHAEETWTVFDHPVIRIFKKI